MHSLASLLNPKAKTIYRGKTGPAAIFCVTQGIFFTARPAIVRSLNFPEHFLFAQLWNIFPEFRWNCNLHLVHTLCRESTVVMHFLPINQVLST